MTSCVSLAATSARAQTAYVYEILHSFTGNDGHGFNGDTDGANPAAALIQGPDGYFYGTTQNGSASNTAPYGTVFRIDAAGTLTILHHFLGINSYDAVQPRSRLVHATDGNYYGTTWDVLSETAHGGGALYKIDAAGNYARLYTFDGTLGAGPYSALVQGTDGSFYGTTTRGGGHLAGTFFKSDSNGNVVDLYDLTDSGGYNYFKSDVFQAADGNFYGMTLAGGTSGLGTVFKFTSAGGFTRIHNFTGTPGLDGATPIAGFVQAPDGFLYGTTSGGGVFGYGTVFKMDYAGNVTVLHSFTFSDGADPRARLLLGSDGNFYGTTFSGGTAGYGVVFKMQPSGVFDVLHNFVFPPLADGVRPTAELTQAADGRLYGTTYGGGSDGKGTVFRLTPRAIADFDRDAKTDRTVFRPSNGVWYSSLSGGLSTATGWGDPTDVDVAGDYDGDGKVDVAVWRPATGTWYIIQSRTGTVRVAVWGSSGDIPLAGDVDGDGKDDLAIYRPSAGAWFFTKSGGGTSVLGWGINGDTPLLGDFDGDGKMDATIYRPSTGVWYIKLSAGGSTTKGWGVTGDIPVIGDWDGDGKSDVTIYRPVSGQWFVSKSTGGTAVTVWGTADDIPMSGDWDGDGKSDYTVWRPSTGVWFTQQSTGGVAVAGWGLTGDRPIGRVAGS